MEESHMQAADEPPKYSQLHDTHTLNLPSVPATDIPPIHHERTLPPLPPNLSESTFRPSELVDHKYQHATPWLSTNPLSAYYHPGSQTSPSTRSTIGMDSPNTMEIDVATPDSRGRRAGSVLSIDDPDVRLAAEALGDLRAADYVQSPRQNPTSLPNSQRVTGAQPEPLLSLLTTSHPIIGNAIGGSLSAYSASKNYSPRFKSSAEYVERRFTPVVNTVGSVGRMTGVEGSVRWFLGGAARKSGQNQTPNVASNDQGSHKRRRVNGDVEMGGDQSTHLHHRDRRASQSSTVESLPAYDEHRSPSYEAHAQQALIPTEDSTISQNSTWQSRLMLSTSGLSVAMSEESLRSLKYCLSWLKWANDHIGKVIDALKTLLDQYDSKTAGSITNGDNAAANSLIPLSDADRAALTTRMGELKTDILKTLKDVIDVVSKYAGGALPENARILVKRHLTSLPQRFRLATRSDGTVTDGEVEARDGAQKMLVLAKEGLDMMSQISGVLDGTIVSAEEWCDRLGRKNRGEPEIQEAAKMPLPPPVTAPLAIDAKSNGVDEHMRMDVK